MFQPRDKAAAFWDRGRAKTHACCLSHILWIVKCFITGCVCSEKFHLPMKWKLFSLKSSGKILFGISYVCVEIFRQSLSKCLINCLIREFIEKWISQIILALNKVLFQSIDNSVNAVQVWNFHLNCEQQFSGFVMHFFLPHPFPHYEILAVSTNGRQMTNFESL